MCTAVQTHSCKHARHKNSLTSVNWQVINFMMQNQNTRDEDGEKKNSVVCNGVCPDSSKKHPPSPLRNPCLCILKSFCCCGCYCCCFQSVETVATTFQISDIRGRGISEWQLLCCMIYYRSKVRTEASVFCDSQVDKCCHFSVREVFHRNCDTSVCLGT